MRRTAKLIVASAALAFTVNQVQAVDILFQKNGFADLSSGQVTGTGIGAQSIGSNATDVLLTGLVAGGSYSVDFFHNSGALSSDFGFTLDGGGNIATIGLGGGAYTMATGVGSTTLGLNTFSVTYNANQGQTGNYFINGILPASGNNSLPQTVTLVPGLKIVDNLYNTGGGNEDYRFIVDSSGNAVIPAGVGGGPTAIPLSEYASASGATVNINHIIAHYTVVASAPITINLYQPSLAPIVVNGTTYDFDIDLTVGNAGFFISSFGAYTIDGGNAVHQDGVLWTDPSHNTGGNDYPFLPMLRYDASYANGYDYYFVNGTGGKVATGSATGFFDGNVTPLSVSVTATLIPEPASLALLAAGGLLLLRRRAR